jgi:hypothetical protein
MTCRILHRAAAMLIRSPVSATLPTSSVSKERADKDGYLTMDAQSMPSRWENVRDSWIAARPARAYSLLSTRTVERGLWVALRRPLFIAFVFGCVIALIARDPFNPRLVISVALCWLFLPASEAVGLLAVIWPERRRRPLSAVSDLFFAGHVPWLLWFAAVGLAWSSLSPAAATTFPSTHAASFVVVTVATLLWSLYIDYCFFRFLLGRTRSSAIGSLAAQRLVSWSLIFLVIEWAAVGAGVFHSQGR